MRLILASASPARLKVLRAAGVEPLVDVSDVDEESILSHASKVPGSEPHHVVGALALAKARDVAQRWPNDLVIGCDSMLLCGGTLVGKPHTADAAISRWRSMRGTSGRLLTGHAVIAGAQEQVETESTTIHFSNATDAEIASYVATGEPLEVAGGFTLDGIGGWLIDRIEGSPSSVIGLGLPVVRRMVRNVGLNVFSFTGGD